MSAAACVVLVPVGGPVDPGCERSLQVLERRGYTVRRVPGFSAIDFGRSVLASEALADGFQELMWIDADIAFDPDDVDRLRAHRRPIVCGVYAKKSRREFACDFLPGTRQVVFGQGGGLIELRYAGFGFVLTRKEVFDQIRTRLALPACNERFGRPIHPYFLPLTADDPPGRWYLGEDYSFCERARRCGVPILADTTIRLWHVGTYGFSWEDAGSDKDRYATYTFHITDSAPASAPAPAAAPPAPAEEPSHFSADWFSQHRELWKELLGPLAGRPVHALEVGVFEGRSTVWLCENIVTHPEATLTYIDTFAGGPDMAGMDLTGLEARFLANTRPFRDRLRGRKGRSDEQLAGLPKASFDFVYIDGSHEAPDVLSDAVLSWPLLKPGGLLAFDDYAWDRFAEPERCPRLAIDAFLSVMRGGYELLHKGYQVWVRKLR